MVLGDNEHKERMNSLRIVNEHTTITAAVNP